MSKDIYNPDHYLNEAGYDLFEEWYIRYPFEVFRIIMWCTAERYFRRYFNKNGVEDLRKGMRVVERLEEYEERYYNEKYDWDRVAKNTISSIEGDGLMDTQDMSSMYPPSLKDRSSHNMTYDEYVRKVSDRFKNDGDVEIFRTNYLKEIDVLEAVYKGLQDVLDECGPFESYIDVEELKEAIYDRLDALEKSYSILHWYDDDEGIK